MDSAADHLPSAAQTTADGDRPGRLCPAHYGYRPAVFRQPAELIAEAVYVVGGLYGNLEALETIEALRSREAMAGGPRPALIFNGDFHWFDAQRDWYGAVQQAVIGAERADCLVLRGNVETELAHDDERAGCGCAYPAAVPDAEVERSNLILAQLRDAARAWHAAHPVADSAARSAFAGLPMHARVQIGAARIGIVHGDAWSLAGWRFAHDRLHEPAQADAIAAALADGAVDGFACSHTCAPALARIGTGFVVNNGAAGMANFSGRTFGVLTRLSVRPLPAALAPRHLYGAAVAGIHIDALRIDFDVNRFLARFDAVWPADSPAALSYRHRIINGPRFSIADARGVAH